ncbi:MAG TPA: aldo/keto reductase [Polyangiaceae bacterium]|nr:aldo/keto reductase [Polyangiaceae bacterium]
MKLTRRQVVKYSLAGAGAVGISGAVGYREWLRHRYVPGAPLIEDKPGMLAATNTKVTQRRRLGRTNLQVSVVSIGAGGLEGPEPIARAVDKGMNYIDTAICYGGSEKVIARALQLNKGLREKLIIATKWDAGHNWKKSEILDSLNDSLKRLGVSHIDIMQLHWLGGGHKVPDDGFNRLDNPELYLAMAEAKKSGKVRFFGATSHAGDRSKILMHAIDKGAFDMLLIKMNVLDYETADIPSLLAYARAKDVGVVVMKSQPAGDRVPKGYEKSKYSVYQSNLRWVLEHDVASVCHSKLGTDAGYQDLAVGAVQEKFSESDRALLYHYASALSPDYCRSCGEQCVPACPHGIAIPHVVQFAMYNRQYGWHERAKQHYQELPVAERWSETCLSCTRCNDACSYGFDAASQINEAKQHLG